MFVKINMNKLDSGKVQIAVYRANFSTGPVKTYQSPDEAGAVLLAFGIPSQTVKDKLSTLSEIDPRELLKFDPMEVPDEILSLQGLRP